MYLSLSIYIYIYIYIHIRVCIYIYIYIYIYISLRTLGCAVWPRLIQGRTAADYRTEISQATMVEAEQMRGSHMFEGPSYIRLVRMLSRESKPNTPRSSYSMENSHSILMT